jgi:hypothetical protein
VAPISIFVAFSLIHVPWILILNSSRRFSAYWQVSSHISSISMSNSSRRLWVLWSTEARMEFIVALISSLPVLPPYFLEWHLWWYPLWLLSFLGLFPFVPHLFLIRIDLSYNG